MLSSARFIHRTTWYNFILHGQYGHSPHTDEGAEVNGQAAVIIRTDDQALLVLTIEVEAEQIQAIRIIANPEKLARI
jgi:hypothetical protein